MDDSLKNAGKAAWFGAEAERAGRPVMIRGRGLPSDRAMEARFPFLLAATRRYDVVDDTGLPTAEQYEATGDLEREALDCSNSRGSGFWCLSKLIMGPSSTIVT